MYSISELLSQFAMWFYILTFDVWNKCANGFKSVIVFELFLLAFIHGASNFKPSRRWLLIFCEHHKPWMQPSLSYLLWALFLISNYPFGSLFSLQDLGHKFTRPCLQCLSAKRLNAILKCEKLFSHLLSTSNPLFTNLNVTCAMQVMLVTHLATYTSELRNTKAQVHQSASTSVLNILQHLKILVIVLAF